MKYYFLGLITGATAVLVLVYFARLGEVPAAPGGLEQLMKDKVYRS